MRCLTSSFLFISVALLLKEKTVEGHGFLKTPRSRNWVAYEDGVDSGGNVNKGKPQREYCAHCLNTKAANHLCGKGNAATNYDDWNDINGDPMPWISQGTYDEGDEFVVEAVLSTNHAGHMEMWVCPFDDLSQECLWSNPAKMIRDEIFDGPVVSRMQHGLNTYYWTLNWCLIQLFRVHCLLCLKIKCTGLLTLFALYMISQIQGPDLS